MNLNHLTGELKLSRYKAPFGSSPGGRVIGAGREEIEFLSGGTGYFEVEGRRQAVGCGCMLWHLPGEETIHLNDPANPYECLVFVFPVTGEPLRQAPRVSFWEDTVEAKAFLAEVLNAFHRDDIDRQALAHYAYSRLLWQAHVYSVRRSPNELPRKLQTVLGELDRGWNRGVSLREVARTAQVSQPHLHHLFQKHLQTTPHQYLLQRRLREARHLLASSDLSVKEVAFRCGFHGAVNFCRLFKTRFHTTPAAYRACYTGLQSLVDQ
ncbi:MAG: AraC family transcriptional regulator [Verrucomicrobiae bacterium]|nr:AraC family transcriptional regulator [Verrucomicrobiae bacterium]